MSHAVGDRLQQAVGPRSNRTKSASGCWSSRATRTPYRTRTSSAGSPQALEGGSRPGDRPPPIEAVSLRSRSSRSPEAARRRRPRAQAPRRAHLDDGADQLGIGDERSEAHGRGSRGAQLGFTTTRAARGSRSRTVPCPLRSIEDIAETRRLAEAPPPPLRRVLRPPNGGDTRFTREIPFRHR